MQHSRTGTWVAYYALGGLVLGGLVLLAILWPENPQLDPKTLCPRAGQGVQARTTVVLLDRTDPLTEVQQQDIVGRLTEVLTAAEPHERFVVYELDARAEIVLNGYVRCNPMGPKQTGPIGWFLTDEAYDRKRVKDQFRDPMIQKVAESLPNIRTTQPDSPIMEMIQAVFVRDLRDAGKRRLIVVSDLMQHSKRYSQYSNAPNFERFARSDAFRELAVDLTRTSVLILFISRTRGQSRQPRGLEQFWQGYFSALGVRQLTIQRVRGEGWQQ